MNRVVLVFSLDIMPECAGLQFSYFLGQITLDIDVLSCYVDNHVLMHLVSVCRH